MAASVPLRPDFDAEGLPALAKGSRDPGQTRRLLAVSAIYADAGGRAGRGRASDGSGLGRGVQRARSRRADRRQGAQGPSAPERRAAGGAAHAGRAGSDAGRPRVVRRRLLDLAQILFEDHGVSVSEQTLSRVLRGMGYSKLSARPRHHAQDPDDIPAFKKLSRPPGGDRAGHRRQADRGLVFRRGLGRPEEHDPPRWARRSTRPSAPTDRRTASIPHPEPVEGRGDLPRPRQRGRLRHAPLYHRGDGAAPRRDRPGRCPRCARRAAARSGRLAHDQETRRTRQHHLAVPAGPLP